MTSMVLRLPITTYWLHARGEGGAADFDLVIDRDDDDLPVVRGKHVKGLLRLALERAVRWKWIPDSENDLAALLLGDRKGDRPGCLTVDDATVSSALRVALKTEPGLAAELFVRLPSTAIDPDTGTALPKHLRTVEGVMPICLQAPIGFDPLDLLAWTRDDEAEKARAALAERHWRTWLVIAIAALDEAGAKRTRGFGALVLPELTS